MSGGCLTSWVEFCFVFFLFFFVGLGIAALPWCLVLRWSLLYFAGSQHVVHVGQTQCMMMMVQWTNKVVVAAQRKWIRSLDDEYKESEDFELSKVGPPTRLGATSTARTESCPLRPARRKMFCPPGRCTWVMGIRPRQKYLLCWNIIKTRELK
jgi:hypothetical protein